MGSIFATPIPSRMKQSMRLLDRWHVSASADGTLWIQPRRSPVQFIECIAMLKRLTQIIQAGPLRAVVFDLGTAQIAEHRWQVLLSIFRSIAVQMKANMRVACSADVQMMPASDSSG